MAFDNQSSSWNSGENFNSNPNSQMFGSDYFEFQCRICNDYGHQDYQCSRANQQPIQQSLPNSGFEQNFQGNNWNSQSFNQGDNQCTSFPEPQLDPSSHQGNFHWNDNASPIIGQQVADLQAKLEKVMALLSSMTDLIIARTSQQDREIDQQAERITAMEQAQSKSDEIIKAQSEKIKPLEETVKLLETRLKKQQNEQSHQCAANLRRIKQLHIEVPTLRQGLRSTDDWLSHVQNEQSAINCVVKEMIKKNESYTGFPDPNRVSSSCRIDPPKGVHYDSDSSDSDDEFQASCEQLWGHIGSRLDGGKSQQQKEIAQEKIENTSPPAPRVLSKEEESRKQDSQYVRLGIVEVVESSTEVDRLEKSKDFPEVKNSTSTSQVHSEKSVTPPKSTDEPSTSCSGCGLNCTHQLRACVNMIQAMPSMKKVEETEVRKMRSKHKRKLQRAWVPRGTFDLKELCRIDTILSELKCIHQVLPRVKKRQKRPPDFHDSRD